MLEYSTARKIPLCASPNYTHGDESCTAWITLEENNSFPVIVDEENILLHNGHQEGYGVLEVANRDGSNRWRLLQMAWYDEYGNQGEITIQWPDYFCNKEKNSIAGALILDDQLILEIWHNFCVQEFCHILCRKMKDQP